MIPTVDEVDIMVHNGSEFVGYLYDGPKWRKSTASHFMMQTLTKTTDPMTHPSATDIQHKAMQLH